MGFGGYFTFLARQEQITIDNVNYYYMVLLFFHRKLKRLIAIELKPGKLKMEHKSQIKLYLRWLDKYERNVDALSVSIQLCVEKSDSLIVLLELGKSDIHVAQYLTGLSKKKMLEAQFIKSIRIGKGQLSISDGFPLSRFPFANDRKRQASFLFCKDKNRSTDKNKIYGNRNRA